MVRNCSLGSSPYVSLHKCDCSSETFSLISQLRQSSYVVKISVLFSFYCSFFSDSSLKQDLLVLFAETKIANAGFLT